MRQHFIKGIDHKLADRRQRDREAMLVAQDRADERIEALRAQAEDDALEGKVANLQDTVVSPTPEWMSKGETVPYTPRGRDGTVKTVKTVRRRLYDAVTHMEGRGVLDMEQAHACRWYRATFEKSQLDGRDGIARYDITMRSSDNDWSHLPSSEYVAQARAEFRDAKKALPVGAGAVLEHVILNNLPLERAARSMRKHKNYVRLHLRNGADSLVAFLKVIGKANRNAR